ncbi:MAG: hypothetical protein IH948_08650 [Bacteroidetes bacterium]|nr:hypothetical protein [Bacteroidota bacterium]
MKPQDVVLLLKIICNDNNAWGQKPMAVDLGMSQSEISESVARSKYAGLLDGSGKKVMRMALMDFLQYGIKYAFPQKPGPIVRGIPTAHSMEPLVSEIESEEHFVWPSPKGELRGQSIAPLYSSVIVAVQNDNNLHELLALVDAIRVGKVREQNMAIDILRSRIC